jgi:hypothetical protein
MHASVTLAVVSKISKWETDRVKEGESSPPYRNHMFGLDIALAHLKSMFLREAHMILPSTTTAPDSTWKLCWCVTETCCVCTCCRRVSSGFDVNLLPRRHCKTYVIVSIYSPKEQWCAGCRRFKAAFQLVGTLVLLEHHASRMWQTWTAVAEKAGFGVDASMGRSLLAI